MPSNEAQDKRQEKGRCIVDWTQGVNTFIESATMEGASSMEEVPELKGKDENDSPEEEDDETSSVASEDTVAPEYDNANSLPFYRLCTRLEAVWKKKFKIDGKRTKKITNQQKIEQIQAASRYGTRCWT